MSGSRSAPRVQYGRRSRTARIPIVSSLSRSAATCARKSSLRPMRGDLKRCSLASTSQSPALSAWNSERVWSTTSPRTAVRSSVPVSSFVTDRSARARWLSRRARPSSRALTMVVAAVAMSERTKAGVRDPAEAESRTSRPIWVRRVARMKDVSSPSSVTGLAGAALDAGGAHRSLRGPRAPSPRHPPRTWQRVPRLPRFAMPRPPREQPRPSLAMPPGRRRCGRRWPARRRAGGLRLIRPRPAAARHHRVGSGGRHAH